MPVSKNGQGQIIFTPRTDQYDGGILVGTGVEPANSFAVADEVDVLKQVKIDPSSQVTNTNVIFKTQSATPGTDVIITFPNVSTTLGGGGGDSFTTMQVPNGTSPVATSSNDTLTWTSSDGSVTITGTAATDTINLATRYSNSAAGSESQVFGASNSGTGTRQMLFGTGISAGSNSGVVAIGYDVFISGSYTAPQNSVCIGYQSRAHGAATGSIAIGVSSEAKNAAVALGRDSIANNSSIAIGTGASAQDDATGYNICIGTNAVSTYGSANNLVIAPVNGSAGSGSNQIVFGSSSAAYTTMYLGEGITSDTPQDFTINATGGVGTNIAAGKLIIAGGKSTGNATPGVISLRVTDAGSSGTTAQTLTELMEIGSEVITIQRGTRQAAIATKTGDYTLTAKDYTILGDASGGAITLTLPTSVGATGQIYQLKRLNSGANNVTVATTSSQTIDGATTYTLSMQYENITVQSDGANWVIL